VAKSFADKVFFCNSGAEANEGAFKFARRWARTLGDAKHEIIALRGAFHGRLFATLAATDRPSYRLPFRPLTPGVSIFERDLRELDAALSEDTVAALIVEPVQGEGGVRVLDPGFLRELRAITKARKIALILDEIQCGLGRTGTLFAYEQAGIEPDMVTLAKPIAGGLPMGAILMTEEIASAVKAGDHGTTFGGGPFVASVALHVFERLSDPKLLDHVRTTGAWFGKQLNEIAHPRSRAYDRRVVRKAAQRDRASYQPHSSGTRRGTHVGHRRHGDVGARRERSAGPWTARVLRRRLHRAPVAATRGHAG
jgi:acetylornithine/succinyldiaminopimelate/putrescine aminotransferase